MRKASKTFERSLSRRPVARSFSKHSFHFSILTNTVLAHYDLLYSTCILESILKIDADSIMHCCVMY